MTRAVCGPLRLPGTTHPLPQCRPPCSTPEAPRATDGPRAFRPGAPSRARQGPTRSRTWSLPPLRRPPAPRQRSIASAAPGERTAGDRARGGRTTGGSGARGGAVHPVFLPLLPRVPATDLCLLTPRLSWRKDLWATGRWFTTNSEIWARPRLCGDRDLYRGGGDKGEHTRQGGGAQQGRRCNQNSGNREPEWSGWESVRMGGSDNKGDGLASQPRRYRVPGQPLLNRHQVGGVSRSPDGLFAQQEREPIRGRPAVRGKRTYGGRPGQRVEEQGTWAAQKHSEAGYGRPVDRAVWTEKTVK